MTNAETIEALEKAIAEAESVEYNDQARRTQAGELIRAARRQIAILRSQYSDRRRASCSSGQTLKSPSTGRRTATRPLPPDASHHQRRQTMKYSQKALEEAFNLVVNNKNWKNPIDAEIISGPPNDVIRAAVIHFTGSVPTITRTTVAGHWPNGLVRLEVPARRIEAAGYYATIGA